MNKILVTFLFIVNSALAWSNTNLVIYYNDGSSVVVENLPNEVNDIINVTYLLNHTYAQPQYELWFYMGSVEVKDNGTLEALEDPYYGNYGKILFVTPFDSIDKMMLVDTSSIPQLGDELEFAIGINNGVLSIRDCAIPLNISIYNVNGIVEYQNIISDSCEVNINQYGRGVHIININNKIFKTFIK